MLSIILALITNIPMILTYVILGGVVFAILVRRLEPKKAFCRCTEQLHGKTVLVTGGNSGIGLETARDLARRGAKVIIASRDIAKSEKAVQEIIETTGNKNVEQKYLDLASFDSVKKFAEDFNKNYEHLDILVNNAGTYGLEEKPTQDGIDIVTQINYFGPFLLTNLLLPKIISSKPSRIVIVSSFLHHITVNFGLHNLKGLKTGLFYTKGTRYNHSKLCQILWMKALARRLPKQVTVNTVHPGAVDTGIFTRAPVAKLAANSIFRLIFKTPVVGAQTLIHLSVSKELENVTGQHFSECSLAKISNKVKTDLIEKVWNESLKITNSNVDFLNEI